MTRTTAVSAIIALALLGTTPAFAARQPAAQAFPLAAQESKADIAAFRDIGQPLTLAIGMAERHSGGIPIAATFAANGGRPVFDVTVYKNGRVQRLEVDADSGKVLASGGPRAAQFGNAARSLLKHLRMTLAQAVGRAEQLGHGKAIEAALQQRNGKFVYAVGLVMHGRVASMTINPLIPHANTSMARSGVPRQQQHSP